MFNFIYYKDNNELNTIVLATGTTWVKNIVLDDVKGLKQHLKYMFGKDVKIELKTDNEYLLSGCIEFKRR